MWKRDALQPISSSTLSTPPVTATEKDWDNGTTPARRVSVFGNAIELEGTIRGEDDVLLYGKLKGRVELPRNSVTIGVEGFLEGDIYAQIVIIEGAVKGNVRATERVVLHRTGQLLGNISCERVMVEEGARVNGSIDMAPAQEFRADRATTTSTAAEEEVEDEESLTH